MVSVDLILWWIAFLLAAGIIPLFLLAYLLFPARAWRYRMDEVIDRVEHAVAAAPQETQDLLRQSKESLHNQIKNLYHPKNYLLPMVFLTLVLVMGFFLLFSVGHPLYTPADRNNLLLNIPASVFYGFVGGGLYALYTAVTRYRTADIPPGLVLQLGYQILLATAVAYFASTLSPDLTAPVLAFAVGFVPYGELVSWLRHTAQARLGTTSTASTGSGPAQSLGEIQGLTPVHRERLGEENILTVQNLALSNPLSLYLVTSFEMARIIDWIDQAYLRMYITTEAAARLAAMGIRGVIEFKQVKEYQPPDETAFLQALSDALGTKVEGALYFVDQMAGDPQVTFLELLWKEFGGT